MISAKFSQRQCSFKGTTVTETLLIFFIFYFFKAVFKLTTSFHALQSARILEGRANHSPFEKQQNLKKFLKKLQSISILATRC